MKRHLILALALAAPLGAAAAPPPNVQQEVTHLLSYIQQSGCQFYRNGSWSDATAALAHVRMKYDHLANGDKIASTQDFIDKAASKSSFSGQPYQVVCGTKPPVLSGIWLGEELARFLKQARR